MTVREILLLGNPRLYQVSEAVKEGDLKDLPPVVADLTTPFGVQKEIRGREGHCRCQIGSRNA